jgi:hypothetical protein
MARLIDRRRLGVVYGRGALGAGPAHRPAVRMRHNMLISLRHFRNYP